MNAPEVAQQIADAYDKQPYQSNAFPYTAPGHLRATAHLYGIETVPLRHARVLELGCAAGGNLLPFALMHPEATVVGVDISPVQVAQGQQLIEELGVDNLTLHAMSLTDITAEFGQFDYIIAHGVFSWVPLEVKEALLRVCRQNLAPLGVAYVSYNTYPGWKAGDILRDAMLMHSHGAASEDARVGSARAVLNLLSEGLAASNPLAPSMRAAVQQLRTQSDHYIAHEHLEAVNTPCYLVEFVDMAQQSGLAYVGDAEAQSEMPVTYGDNVRLNLSLIAMGQPKAMRQQYLDFAVGRMFRKSLLVHADRAEQIADLPRLQALEDLHFAAWFDTQQNPDELDPNRETYVNQGGRKLSVIDPFVKRVIATLSQAWPSAVSWAALQQQWAPESAPDHAAAKENLAEALASIYRLGLLRVGLASEASLPGEAGEHPGLPRGWSVLQRRLQQDPQFGVGLFDRWHGSIKLRTSEAQMLVYAMLDGKTPVSQMRTALRDALTDGRVAGPGDKPLTGQRNLDATAQNMVGITLTHLHKMGVLAGHR